MISDDDTILESSTSIRSFGDGIMEDDEGLEDDPEFDEFEAELAESETEDLELLQHPVSDLR